jgi:hypothetical protein
METENKDQQQQINKDLNTENLNEIQSLEIPGNPSNTNNYQEGSNNNVNNELNNNQGYFKDNMVSIDPYTAHALIMRSEMYIVYNYPNLITINQKLLNEKILELIPDDASVFIIKSFTEEDIHKSIKYNIWSSTNFGNNKLNLEYQAKQGKVYLLFSTYKSNQFTGFAQMKSEVNFKNTFPLWARDNWRATFNIEWLLIKDVPFKEFRNVNCVKREKKSNGEYNFINYSTKSLSNSPDCQTIPTNEAKEIIQCMVDYQNKNSILEHFEYYDRRQANYEAFLQQNKSNPENNNVSSFNNNYNNNKGDQENSNKDNNSSKYNNYNYNNNYYYNNYNYNNNYGNNNHYNNYHGNGNHGFNNNQNHYGGKGNNSYNDINKYYNNINQSNQNNNNVEENKK